MAGATLSLAGSLGLGIGALRGVENRCLATSVAAGEGDPSDGSALARRVDHCVAAQPALVAAGLGSGLALITSVGLATAGGWKLRPSAESSHTQRSRAVRASIGSVLLSAGVLAALVSRLDLRLNTSCLYEDCLRETRANDLVVRTLGGTAASIGGALLGSLVPKPKRERYARISPHLGRNAGVLIYGEF